MMILSSFLVSFVGSIIFYILGFNGPQILRMVKIKYESRRSLKPISCGGIILKPWGQEEIWAQSSYYTGKILTIRAGESLSKQYHRYKDETIRVLEGRMMLRLEQGSEKVNFEMIEGDSYHITPRMIHQMEAITDVRVLEVSTPELEDVVRLQDRYGRVL